MILRRLFALLLPIMLLAACSGQPVRPVVQDTVQAWRLHQQAMQKLDNWELRGRIAVQTEYDGFNANFRWRQWDENYHIHLSGPFGIGALTLAGNPDGVALRSRGETVLHRGDAEMLFLRQTGVQLPIKSLRYWVRGIPQRGIEAKIVLDNQGRLKELQQSGWQIEYKRYTRYRGVVLPAKLFLDNHQLKVRLVIDRWILARPPVLQQQGMASPA